MTLLLVLLLIAGAGGADKGAPGASMGHPGGPARSGVGGTTERG
ncbi:hypothetical protein [Pseudoxanthomonas winnipegensis]|nr:hypothetical protein [Pseudoxanthomonas winnipegensis]